MKEYLNNYMHLKYNVNGIQQQQANTVKMLGIILDKQWTFNPMITKTVTNMQQRRQRYHQSVAHNECKSSVDMT